MTDFFLCFVFNVLVKIIDETEKILYDEIGNPTTYLGANMWWRGRKLTSYRKDGVDLLFTYDASGLRGSKTVGSVKTTYQYVGDKLYYENRGNGKELYYFYDSFGNLSAISYFNGTEHTMYYALTNSHGDVLGLYDAWGKKVAAYDYDAWGNATVYKVTQNENGNNVHSAPASTDDDHISVVNPIRYRGYYYDAETGFYYVSSRYYDPEIGRWINADDIAYLGTGGLTSYNLFAYCGNNPVMGYDPYGTFDFWGFAKGVGRIVTGIAAVAAGVAVCVAGAPVAMIAVAAVTITAGVLTAVNGAADIQQSVTGNNFVRDTVFNGNQTAYDVYSGVTETVAAVGTAVCGNYLSTNCTMKGAVPGTEGKVTLEPGTTLDRYGSQYGRYLTDPGTSINQLALTPGNSCNLTTYVVNRPFTFRTGVVAPCAWGPGGGVQYFSWMSVQRLVQFGFLTPIG